MPSEPVTIRELVAALETVEAYTRTVRQLLKTLPQGQVIPDPTEELDPGTLPRIKGCDPGRLTGPGEILNPPG